MLGLRGLRIFEACGASIINLGEACGNRVLNSAVVTEFSAVEFAPIVGINASNGPPASN